MPSTVPIAHLLSDVWFDRLKVEEEEYKYEVYAANQRVKPTAATTNKRSGGGGGVAEKIAEARQKIHQTLQESDSGLAVEDSAKLNKLQSENAELRKIVNTLVLRMNVMESRLSKLESESGPTPSKDPAPEQKPAESADDDSDDLFGSDEEEDIEADRIRKERLAAYMEKKSKKTAVIAKSTIVLEVKPWDDETDMAELEKCVRSVTADGLIWGASKLEKVAYGIMKLQITCVVEDDKVGTDFLEERITEFDEYIQSVDIVAFNKI